MYEEIHVFRTYLFTCVLVYLLLPRPPKEPFVFCGRIISTSLCGLGITWTDASSPTRLAAAAPASVAAFTAPTSPRTITVTYPPPTYSLPMRVTFAALTIASAASIAPTRPLVSTIPNAIMETSTGMAYFSFVIRFCCVGQDAILPYFRLDIGCQG